MLRVDTERRFYPDLKIGVWRRRTYQFMFDITIFMNQNMALTDDLLPGDFGMGIAEYF